MNTQKKAQLEAAHQVLLDLLATAILPEEATHLFSDDISALGTNINEKIIGLKQCIELWQQQNQQATDAGLKTKVDCDPFARHVLKAGEVAVLVDDLTVTVLAGEEKLVHPLRLTTVWALGDGNWKIIHFHGSIAVNADTEQDAWLVEEWKSKQAELEKLVVERTAELTQRNRELAIEAALERVRIKAIEINSSQELSAVVNTMYQELDKLGVITEATDVELYLLEEETGIATLWGSESNLTSNFKKVKLSFSEHPALKDEYQQWKATPFEKRKEMLVNTKVNKGLLEETADFLLLIPELAEAAQAFREAGIENWFMHNAYFSHGMISLQGFNEASEEIQRLLRRFATAFEQSYIRVLDLQKAESQAIAIRDERDRLEKALGELQATQTQLIQQEKLASLGQLTAGIAHEIKNPLNFVNNFSELSIELIEEVFEELESLPKTDARDEIKSILTDVKGNLEKVYHHGNRADGIVRSMLQHSRGSSGIPVPTDINEIVREYVNLAYHGMRAGKNPIIVQIEYQLDESIRDVNLTREDFSRVVLNLVNNAFDAMRSKLQSPEPDYLPQLIIKTSYLEGQREVIITVSDNGPGIPKDIQDKILQPFFTTKKGAAGTGLGLSISNDIVKAHGGSISVDSEAGEGTTFRVTLPHR